MDKRLIHPDLMNDLEDYFFTEDCTIQTPNALTSGETEPSGWTDKLTELKGKIAEISALRSGDKVMRKDGTIVMHPWVVVLSTYQATIVEKDRLVIDSVNYDILSVHFDSEDQITRLIVEVVK